MKKPIVIAVCNQKGGCGKTTTVAETGACLAIAGARVLGIDLDHQCNYTEALGHLDEETPGAYELLTGKKRLEEVILESKIPNLHFVPASIDLSAAESELMGTIGREHQLRIALAGAVDDGLYDYILLDNPPNLGVVVMNALTAADFMVVPVQVYKFARRGLDRITTFYGNVRRFLNPDIKDWMVLPTLLDFRREKDVIMLKRLREQYSGKVFATQIHVNSKILESQEVGSPVVVIDRNGAGAKQYKSFACELAKWVAGAGAAN